MKKIVAIFIVVIMLLTLTACEKNWNKLKNKYGEDQMWGINKSFIDQQYGMGKDFVTNLPKYPKNKYGKYPYNGFFFKEIEYLKNQFNINLWG